MRFLWAACLVLFTLVCLPLAAWLAGLNELGNPPAIDLEPEAAELLSRLVVLVAAAPATFVVGPIVGWTGYAIKRSWVSWIGVGLVAVHALATVETLRALGATCRVIENCRPA